MTATKKVFFGSLFDFTSIEVQEILDGLQDQFNDPEAVPFVAYNRNTKLFSCEVIPEDNKTIPSISAQIYKYVTRYGRKPNEPFESDRLTPIAGTAMRYEETQSKPRDPEPNLLFDIVGSSEDEYDEATQAHDSSFWKPKCGDISILSVDIAAEVADETGCFLIPDRMAQRVQLVNGNPPLALQKLERLEDVFIFASPHQSKVTSRANSNGFLLQSGSESRIRFVRPTRPTCAFDRIVLEPGQLFMLTQIVLGEIRIWHRMQWIKPVNLDLEDVSFTAQSGLSGLYVRSKLPALGNATNAEPRVSSKENLRAFNETQRPDSPTKFLGQKEAERVEEWRGQVDPKAAPSLPPEEPVPEVVKTGRRRPVCESEESDEEVTPANKPTTAQATVQDTVPPQSTKDSAIKSKAEVTAQNDKARDIAASEIKKRTKLASSIAQSKRGNMFDLLGENCDADQQGSILGEPASGRSNGKGKELNVSFEEPESRFNGPSPQESLVLKGPSFDPSKYGVQRHMAKSPSEKSRNHPFQSREKSSNALASPVLAVPRPAMRSDAFKVSPNKDESQHARAVYRGSDRSQYRRRQRDLIDVSADESPIEPTMPPPGFNYRTNNLHQPANLLMVPHEEAINRSVLRSVHANEDVSNSSHDASGSTGNRSTYLDFTPQYTIPKRNIGYLKEKAVARLKAQMEAKEANDRDREDTSSTFPPNQIQKEDEHSTREYHKTMSQRMAKPGKGKKNGNGDRQETKGERQARIALVKAEAYGDTFSAKAKSSKSQPKSQSPIPTQDMTVKKRQIMKKNQAMAALHQDTLMDSANYDTAVELVEQLKPILKATRAFKGVIKVEIQVGQALILNTNRLDENYSYTQKEYMELLNAKSENCTNVTFTNIVTTNGQDIDRMLEIKANTESSKLWHNNHPGLKSTIFEFLCQDQAGQDFNLVLDQDGNHILNKVSSTIGQVALHAPSQIWDACAVVSGTMPVLRPTGDILTGVDQFKESIYIPGGEKAAIYYRLPPNNSFTIKAIMMKRVSIHDCLLSGREDVQLRITEVKALAHSSNPTDKRLFRSYESSYDVMINEDRIHYEVAIIDKTIEKAYSANPDIKIGELAPITAPNGKILDVAQARGLIEITTYMIKNIDWLGAYNVGTFRRVLDNAAEQRATIVNTLPPNLNHNLPIPMGTTAPPTIVPPQHQSQYSRVDGTNTATETAEPIFRQLHGVRTNTAAELYQDHSTGEFFYFGQGGARVPVVNDQVEGLRFDGLGPILPGDSASQAGDVRARVGGGSVNVGKARAPEWNDRPAGFW